MKKFTLTIVLLLACFSLFSQENELKKNELKINMSNLIIFKWLDLGYERVLNEESSIGVGTLFSLDTDIGGLDEYRTFSITPYYRQFFSNKYAQGFFVEAFGMLHTGEDQRYYSNSGPYDSYVVDKYTDFAVGISVGAKFISKRGFITEIYAGIGRDLIGESGIEVVGRGGISIGKRF